MAAMPTLPPLPPPPDALDGGKSSMLSISQNSSPDWSPSQTGTSFHTEMTALPSRVNTSMQSFTPHRGSIGGFYEDPETTPVDLAGLPGLYRSDLKEAFDEIDFDSNGFIGASELRYMLMLIGENPSDKEINEMMHMVGCGEGTVLEVGDIVRVTTERASLKRSVGVIGREYSKPWDEESMCDRLDTLQKVLEVVKPPYKKIVRLQPLDEARLPPGEDPAWFCSTSVLMKEANFEQFLGIMLPSERGEQPIVPKEMALLVQDARDQHARRLREEELERAKLPGQEEKMSGPSLNDVELMLKVASGFLYMGNKPGAEQGKNLPAIREPHEGQQRSRPRKNPPPLALSPRSARNANRLAAQNALDPKGKGKGKASLPRSIA